MLAYKINGKEVKVERCAAGLYIVRDIPQVFEKRIAIGASKHKLLVQKFLDSYASKVAEDMYDKLDVDFENLLPMCEENCRGCVYCCDKGCVVDYAERKI
ncbi:MAG: hypothetical protein IKY40_00160 [Phascolarctobacterium sp.]|nr:hypothetical protein [Phascolarctobacterium sp.]MBR5790143.1 hypothetical protein [Phascolarctobacterium sp.]